MNKAIRILLVDGHELVRRGLQHMLELEEDIEVVGDYASAEEAISQIARLHYDIVLMGTNRQQRMNWIEATRSLKRNESNHSIDVIILADSQDYRDEATEIGAASYLLKDITHVELAQTIRQVYRNRHSSKECYGLVDEAVELVIPPSVNAARLLRLMCRLGEILHDDFASIICIVSSWDRGTVITIRLQPTMFSNLLIKLVYCLINS
ncbi:response regulator transcription factor, partial [Chloroflexota bacterium]